MPVPRVYRGMFKDEGGRPAVGNSAAMLGVRIGTDIKPDENSNVHVDGGGMSVAPSMEMMPMHRIPKRLRSRVPAARGNNNYAVWRFGDGPFANGEFSHKLDLRVTSEKHGIVTPNKTMSLPEYEEALIETREQWINDED